VALTWNRTVALCMLVYAAVLITSIRFLQAHPDTPWKIPIAAAPAIPIAVLVVSGIRNVRKLDDVRKLDEFQQRQMLEVLAFAYPAVIVGTITYGFLERAGFAQPNLMFVGVWMFALLGLGRVVAWWHYR
jgi:hypothetical protein